MQHLASRPSNYTNGSLGSLASADEKNRIQFPIGLTSHIDEKQFYPLLVMGKTWTSGKGEGQGRKLPKKTHGLNLVGKSVQQIINGSDWDRENKKEIMTGEIKGKELVWTTSNTRAEEKKGGCVRSRM